MAYHNGQPFNKNHLRPCPMLENPELLRKMVHETGAHSTDLQSPESVDHLCDKCKSYAANWQPTADEIPNTIESQNRLCLLHGRRGRFLYSYRMIFSEQPRNAKLKGAL